MRTWWRYLVRCLWRGHRFGTVTCTFTGCGAPQSILVNECEWCYWVEREAAPC